MIMIIYFLIALVILFFLYRLLRKPPIIFPAFVFNKLESYFFIWIKGENRSGKTNLAFAMAESYLRSKFRLLSNTKSVWNDRFDLENLLDSNGMMNCVVVLDEMGTFMRTKESIREVMGFKGVLNALFLGPSTEEPHEDLWKNYIEPAEGWNTVVSWLFGSWFLDHIFKVWRFVQFDPKRLTRQTLFLHLFPSRTWGTYSTITKRSPEHILQIFQKAFEAQQEFFNNSEPLGLYDLVTKKRGLSDGASFLSREVDNARSLQGERSFFSSQKRRK